MVLKEAINRDACFLEKNQVMDYSLLVGLDEKNDVLVLGIIGNSVYLNIVYFKFMKYLFQIIYVHSLLIKRLNRLLSKLEF